jgi:hypothetical protein
VPDHHNSNAYDASASTSSARHALIERTYALGKRKDLDFDVRVRASRAAGVGAILFSCMPTARMSSSHGFVLPGDLQPLHLPQPDDVGPLLDAYRAHVEPLCNAVVIDLNRPRIRAFLRWWHSDPDSLPADPPLVPLVLVVLALSVQSIRTAGKGGEPEVDRFHGCDVEKRLLETAGRCIDNLQVSSARRSAMRTAALTQRPDRMPQQLVQRLQCASRLGARQHATWSLASRRAASAVCHVLLCWYVTLPRLQPWLSR